MNDVGPGSAEGPEGQSMDVAGSPEDGVELVCPRCGQTGQRPILYGLPTWEGWLQAERGEVVLGGCLVMPADIACPACGLEWESETSPAWGERCVGLEDTRFDHDDEGYVR